MVTNTRRFAENSFTSPICPLRMFVQIPPELKVDYPASSTVVLRLQPLVPQIMHGGKPEVFRHQKAESRIKPSSLLHVLLRRKSKSLLGGYVQISLLHLLVEQHS
jgi:hypothetical protein